MAFLGQEEQLRELQDRFRLLHIVVFIGFGLLVSRLVYLQIFNGDKMRQYSEENRIKRVTIPAPRGMIFDRHRTLLVDNQPSFDLEVTPQYLRESKRGPEVLDQIAKLLDMPREAIDKRLEKARGQPAFMPVKIKTDLTRDEVAKIETWKLNMPGVAVEMEIQRTNVFGEIAAHFLGHIGKVTQDELPKLSTRGYRLNDSIGMVGMERQMEETLRGTDGHELVEVDALGRRIMAGSASAAKGKGRVLTSQQTTGKSAVPGHNLILTIDQDLQLAAKQAFGDKAGGLVAINPKNGEILAMLSVPAFDPTEFSRGISPQTWERLINNVDLPMRDKTIQDHYPPGSVFKAVTALAGLEEGVITKDTVFNCGGKIRVGNREYHCHKRGGHGNVTVTQALEQSCDIFFYRVSQKLKSVNDISKWAFKLGLGNKTNINLPREVSGLIPTEEWKQARLGQAWNGGETLNVAIGQSFVLATVLQLANTYATMANEGILYRPHYVKRIETSDGHLIKEFGPDEIENIHIKPENLELVRKGLWMVVNSPHGTAYSQRLPLMDFAGKTGTSQVVRQTADKIYNKCEGLPYRFRHHGLFAGFAPADDPVIAVAVIAEHACHGSSGAAPIAKAVINTYLKKEFPDKYTDEAIANARKQKAVLPPRADQTEDQVDGE
ncbi:MAG: penicillin-binding protein 2 [Bacteriovoracia bacterium]